MRAYLSILVAGFLACEVTTEVSQVGGAGGLSGTDGGGATDGGGVGGVYDEPETCIEAEQMKSYIGCDYWPTVTTNPVWSIFDFTVVVANTQTVPAEIKIERGGVVVAEGQVPETGLQKFYLPWVKALKGPDIDECVNVADLTKSLRVPDGAYHLTSSVPVTVYQFNALEYKAGGGPDGKDWSTCPGNLTCTANNHEYGCFSYTNDASLLLPSTALTGNYRVTMMSGSPKNSVPSYFAITGIAESGTDVTVQVSASGETFAGGGLPATGKGGVLEFGLARGEVVEIVSTPTSDLAGTQIQASAPVQVISGTPCMNVPFDKSSCDHLEETVFPAETLGKHYFVAPPTGPHGAPVGQIVRLVGNVDGTKLTYSTGAPAGAPTTLQAGELRDLGIVESAFEVSADHEFAIVTFQLGSEIVDPDVGVNERRGDPAQSNAVAVEQYRKKYVFLAPDDYDVSYVDIVLPDDAEVILDGAILAAERIPISSGFSIARAALGQGVSGAHLIVSDKPIGIQVIGYGIATSYQYPGGLNLSLIAPPPGGFD